MYRLIDDSRVLYIPENAVITLPANESYGFSYEAWIAAGNVPLPVEPETPQQAFIRLQAVVQRELDTWAQTRGYEGILSLCTYATSTHSKFQAEGQRGVEVRDACWSFGYDLLAQVEAGSAPIPTDEELIAMLPPMQWPAEATT